VTKLKVILFDFCGVLVTEKDIVLTREEEQLERFFGKNYSDEKYAKSVSKFVPNGEEALKIAKCIIDKLYVVKDEELFSKIRKMFPDLKMSIATNHISYIENYIKSTMDTSCIDKIFVSANLHKVKPHLNFYREIIRYYKLKPEDFLFVDDNQENVERSNSCWNECFKDKQ
jgi:FMN phosphatase YigB (HAD superfamily)